MQASGLQRYLRMLTNGSSAAKRWGKVYRQAESKSGEAHLHLVQDVGS